MTIHVEVSGKPRTFDDGATLAAVVGDLPRRGVAIARNGEVVPRDSWDTTRLQEGDILEVVRPIQGGAR